MNFANEQDVPNIEVKEIKDEDIVKIISHKYKCYRRKKIVFEIIAEVKQIK